MARSEEARARNTEMTRRWRAARSDEEQAQDLERQRVYYRAHREKLLAQQKAQRAADPERCVKNIERHRRRQADPTYRLRRAELRRMLRLADLETARENEARTVRAWRAANSEKRLATDQRRRARLASAPGDFTGEEFIALCEAHGGCCAYCGREAKLTVDHVTPLSRGGSNDIANIVPACGSCNSSKGTKTADEFMAPKAAA